MTRSHVHEIGFVRGIYRQIRHRAAQRTPWSRCQANGGVNMMFDTPGSRLRAAGGDQGGLGGHLGRLRGLRPGRGLGGGHSGSGTARQQPVGLGGGQAVSEFVRNSRIQPMLVDRSALSGISGNYSGHPLRTRSVLMDAAGTARAVFVWSVNLCVAVAAISRFSAGAKLRSWCSIGVPVLRPGSSPALVSRGCCGSWRLVG